MKQHLSTMVVGMLIGVAMPALAQQGEALNPQQLVADLASKWAEAYNGKNAARVAALYTENAAVVTPMGIFEGRDAVQHKWIEGEFQAGGHGVSITVKHAQALGDGTIWSNGEWSGQYGTQPAHGFWSGIYIRDNGEWKALETSTNLALPPPK